jgi:phosphoglycolate phosphatase
MKQPSTQRAIGAIVFDLDGTLIDSRADIAAAVNHTLDNLGYATLPLEQVMSYVGDGAGHLIMRAAGLPSTSPKLKPILAEFLDYYTAHAADKTTWMPGALEALDQLGRYPLAVCTNKPRATTIAVLDAFGAVDRFATIVAGGDVTALKPDPMALVLIAERVGCTPAELVIVGDGPQDIEAGKRAGAFTIGVRGGIATPERLLAADPDLVLHSLLELPEAIARIANTTRCTDAAIQRWPRFS